MRRTCRASIALAAVMLLASACRAAPSSPPTASTSTPPANGPSQNAPGAVAPTRTPATAATCGPAAGKTYAIELDPPAPRAGETSRYRVTGLAAGAYRFAVGIPNSGVFAIHDVPAGAAGADGNLGGTFVLPPDDGGYCLVAIILRADGSGLAAESRPFITSKNTVPPARCNALPQVTQPGVPLSLTVSGTGVPVIVDGVVPSIPAALGDPSTWTIVAGLSFGVSFGSRNDGVVAPRIVSRTSSGGIAFRLMLPARPAWSGLCVSVVVVPSDGGGPIAHGGFDYP